LIADPRRSQINVRNQLAYLRTLLDWAAQNDVIETNPAKEVRIKVTERGEKRKDFDIDDLAALIAGPVHAIGQRPKGCGGEAAYWLPLLALFMGARREELGQLRVSDVRQAPYVDAAEQRQQAWCIDITDTPDEAGVLANQIKNDASRRLIPLHPQLIELGFISYVQGLSNRQGRVFPDLKPVGVGQKLTDKWGQWFGRYKRDLGVTDKLKVFHSFRHTWKTHATEAGISERICREFQGHEGKDAADKYGAKPSMATLVAAIGKYRIPGLKI
jgi:integrase